MIENKNNIIIALGVLIIIVKFFTIQECNENFLNIENCNSQNNCHQVTGFIDDDTKKFIVEKENESKKTLNKQENILHPKCSPACCTSQYPVPFKMTNDSLDKEYIQTGLTCNNSWQSTSCLCMTKDYDKYLKSRGGNNV